MIYNTCNIPTNETIKDEFGATYSVNGKIIYEGPFPSIEIDVYKIRDGVELIADRAFQTRKIKNIILPESVKAIGVLAFANNTQLQEINIPSYVDYIANDNPFGGCFNLNKVDCLSNSFMLVQGLLMNKEKTILYGAVPKLLPQINNLYSIDVENGIEAICANAFWGVENIGSLIIPQSVTSIGKKAFYFCKGTRIIIKAAIEEIDPDWGFSLTPKPIGFSIIDLKDSSIVNIGKNVCFHGGIIKEVILPNNLQTLSCYIACSNLCSITIPFSVKEINWDISNSVNNIERVEFLGSPKLTDSFFSVALCIIDCHQGLPELPQCEYFANNMLIIDDKKDDNHKMIIFYHRYRTNNYYVVNEVSQLFDNMTVYNHWGVTDKDSNVVIPIRYNRIYTKEIQKDSFFIAEKNLESGKILSELYINNRCLYSGFDSVNVKGISFTIGEKPSVLP